MSTAAFAGLSGRLFESTAHAGDLRDRLRLDVSAFPSLEFNSGSAIVSFNNGATQFMINRESEVDFYVLDPLCTHMGCRVDPYSIVTNSIFCPCHSSQYDIHGHVIHGPAANDLNAFTAQFDGVSTLTVEVPGFVHRIYETAVQSATAGNTRLRITFPAVAGGQYQVRHSPTLTDPFEIVAFSKTASGVADRTIFNGTGAVASVYVDSIEEIGFYTLELLISQLA